MLDELEQYPLSAEQSPINISGKNFRIKNEKNNEENNLTVLDKSDTSNLNISDEINQKEKNNKDSTFRI